MITTWTLLVFMISKGYKTVQHSAIFLTKEDCISTGNAIINSKSVHRAKALCYESKRIDTKGN